MERWNDIHLGNVLTGTRESFSRAAFSFRAHMRSWILHGVLNSGRCSNSISILAGEPWILFQSLLPFCDINHKLRFNVASSRNILQPLPFASCDLFPDYQMLKLWKQSTVKGLHHYNKYFATAVVIVCWLTSLRIFCMALSKCLLYSPESEIIIDLWAIRLKQTYSKKTRIIESSGWENQNGVVLWYTFMGLI